MNQLNISKEEYLSALDIVTHYHKQLFNTTKKVLTDEDVKNLHDLYSKIWIEACYDSFNEDTRNYANELLPLIKKLNKSLGFRK